MANSGSERDDSNQKEYDPRVIRFVRSCISMGIQVLAMRPCLSIFVIQFHSEARASVKRKRTAAFEFSITGQFAQRDNTDEFHS